MEHREAEKVLKTRPGCCSLLRALVDIYVKLILLNMEPLVSIKTDGEFASPSEQIDAVQLLMRPLRGGGANWAGFGSSDIVHLYSYSMLQTTKTIKLNVSQTTVKVAKQHC